MRFLGSHNDNSVKQVLLSILLFFLIYNGSFFKYSYIANERIFVVILTIILVFYSRIIYVKNNWIMESMKKMLIVQLFLLIYTSMLFFILGYVKVANGGIVANSILQFIIVVPVACIGLITLYSSTDDFMSSLLYITLFQACIIILTAFNSEIAMYIDSFFHEYYKGVHGLSYSDLRSKGYNGGILCITATGIFKMSLGLIACIHKILQKRFIYRYCFLYLFIVFSMTLVAKTGLIIGIIGGYYIIPVFLHDKTQQSKKILLILPFVLIGIALGIIYGNVGDSFAGPFKRLIRLYDVGIYNDFLRWYFGGYTTVIPGISLETLIGTGITSGTSGNGITVNVDGDYLRLYVAFGLPLAILFYIFLFWMMHRCTLNLRDINSRYISNIFLVFMIVGEFKEQLLYAKYFIVCYYVYLYLSNSDYLKRMKSYYLL